MTSGVHHDEFLQILRISPSIQIKNEKNSI